MAISVNDRRMLNNEILKKNFRFLVKKLIRSSLWEKKIWNFKYCHYIYVIDNIMTDHIKKTSYPSLSRWNCVKIFVS